MVDDALYGVVWLQLFAAAPQLRHQQGELLGEGCLLELETVIELFGGDFQHVIQFGEELGDALLFVFDVHALNGEPHDVDGGER